MPAASTARAVDQFALSDAIREHHKLRKAMETAFRSRRMQSTEEREHTRRQQLQNQASNAHHLARMKTTMNKGNHGAPPSTASLFEVDLVDKRRPLPRHANCQVVHVQRWAEGQSGEISTPRRRASLLAANSALDGPESVLHSPALPDIMSLTGVLSVPPTAPRTGTVIGPSSLTTYPPPITSRTKDAHTVRRVSVTYGGGLVNAAELPSTARDPRQASLPPLQPIGGLTPKIVGAAETDFRMLSYGETHIPLSVLDDLSPDLTLEFLFGRRTPLFQFRTYVEQHGLTSVSFPQFLHIVFVNVSLEDCMLAARRWSPTFGWAANLSEPVAKTLDILWKKWTAPNEIEDVLAASGPFGGGGSIMQPERKPFTFDVYMEMIGGAKDEAHRVGMRPLFQQADIDKDGQLNREEFTQFFSKAMQQLGSVKKEK